MIKFNNLRKACKELDFYLLEADYNHLIVTAGRFGDYICIHKEEAWNISFEVRFRWLESDKKAQLIKAITKDYEEYLNGN